MSYVDAQDQPRTIVLEGLARLKWTRLEHAKWRLERIWPSARERRWVLREVRRRSQVIVLRDTQEAKIDLLDEEISVGRGLAPYVLERDRGVTTLSIPALDWLPERLLESRQSLDLLVRGQSILAGNLRFEPRIGRYGNIQVVRLQQGRVEDLSAAEVAALSKASDLEAQSERRTGLA